jgi:hypothetical protein
MKDAPLREGLFLLAGLALLAWPLSLVTGKAEARAGGTVAIQSAEGEWVTDVSITTAHPFDWIELRRGEEVLGRIEGPATSGEFECLLSEHGDVLLVESSFPEGTPLTALQVQLWPGSLPEVNFTIWTQGVFVEEVEVKFHE